MFHLFLQIPFIKIVLSLSILCYGCAAVAQPAITGPKCILPGLSYQYQVSGNWAAGSNVKVCVTGGKLSGGSTCTPGGSIPFMLFVIWNASGGMHKMELQSDSGNAVISVVATEILNGGLLPQSDRVQVADSVHTSYTFRCSEPAGGNCSPNYIYQWQYSENSLEWNNLTGATTKDLELSGIRSVTTYLRRVTTETNSNSLAYSDQGVLVVVL